MLIGSLVAPATPASAADYPSWSDVQAAQQNEAATQAMIETLDSALDDAQTQATALSDAALTAATTAEQARTDADAAAVRADDLSAQSAAADATLADTRAQLGVLASGLYRTQSDGALLARLLTSAEPETLLSQLGLLDKLTGTWADLFASAQRDAGTAESLRAQAAVAQEAEETAAQTAEQAASDAQAAADAEAAQVASLQSQTTTMYAQLATLKNTTAETEQQYRLGQQVAAQAAAQAAAAAAAAASAAASSSSSSSSGSSGSSSTSSTISTYGVVVDPARAKAYARTTMSSRYGWGDDQYQCLVLLWTRESSWRADALNSSSGAYGIPQSLPADKMASAGADWRTNGNTQVDWGLSYIASRYSTPCAAWAHSQSTGWY